tara:strand:- start:704 stop:1381 length:678 start_codon:yes stop_codon:yes gene_type:complete
MKTLDSFKDKNEKSESVTLKEVNSSAKVEKNLNIVKATNLEDLRNELDHFEGCALKNTSKSLVFSDGNSKAKVMLLGEAPGEEEDKTGKPFKGQAGILLDKMLNAIGQNRENTYISNLIYWRPPGNRNPTDEEIYACLPFVLKHIEIIKPKILILAGAVAAKAILKEKQGIIQTRGKWHNFVINNSITIRTIPIYHPAFLLRQPSRKRDAWEDLKKIKKEIDLIT